SPRGSAEAPPPAVLLELRRQLGELPRRVHRSRGVRPHRDLVEHRGLSGDESPGGGRCARRGSVQAMDARPPDPDAVVVEGRAGFDGAERARRYLDQATPRSRALRGRRAALVEEAMTEPDLDDIQGLVYSAWSDHVYAGYLFATLANPERSRAWLLWIHPHITPARRARRTPHGRVQVALSPQGLEVLGVPRDVVDLFPQETKEGMAHRGRVLDDAPPTRWQLGIENELHVLVMVYARDHASRAALLEEHCAKLLEAGA